MTSPLRIFTWHIHGSYMYYLAHSPHQFYLPVKPDRTGGYGSGVRLGHQSMEASTTVYSRSVDNVPEVRNDEAARAIVAHDAGYGPAYRQCGLPAGVLFNGCDYERLQKDIGEVVAYLR